MKDIFVKKSNTIRNILIVVGISANVALWTAVGFKFVEVVEKQSARNKENMAECLKERKKYECDALLNKDSGDILIISTF